ncbi:protein FAR1-RELATED SEQUENCE 2-like [Humulus lupulus]|uniref:protein FAR1-RELATED SEQUENCE 2-like n=1 Tax=Humulus lupulus TaxID=3486 RepID=UPI002B4034AA|nr:protein FAR1-RELATED SEQUENCE 2-like [Humulus lupulus]
MNLKKNEETFSMSLIFERMCLIDLYEERHRWVPAFVKETFSAGEKDGAYYVTGTLFIGDKQKEMTYNVQFNNETCEVKCACRLFEFKILCRHALSVLIQEHVKIVPGKYIVPRWRKDIKRCHTRIKVNYNEWSGRFETRRYDKLQTKFYEVANWAAECDEHCETFWNVMNELQSKGKNCDKKEGNAIHSPMVVRRHGRPPKKHKVSWIEKLISMKKKVQDKKVKT